MSRERFDRSMFTYHTIIATISLDRDNLDRFMAAWVVSELKGVNRDATTPRE